MSRLNGSDAKGLMEAYAAVYASQEQPELVEQVEETNIQEDFEIDPDALLECVKEYLVVAGYAKGEKEAVNMLPHLSENFFVEICSQIIINESFYSTINCLIEEGYDLTEYTWDELFESYIGQLNDDTNVLLEVVPALAYGAAATSPWWMPAAAAGLTAAGGLYALNKNKADKWAAQQVSNISSGIQGAWNKLRGKGKETRVASPAEPVRAKSGRSVTATRPPGSSTSQPGPSQRGSGGQPPEEPPRSNFNPRLRNTRRQQQERDIQRQERQRQNEIKGQQRARQAQRFFQQVQNWNQTPAKVPDIGTTLGRARTAATALKNLAFGKTGLGLATRVGGSLGADELVFQGANRERASQALQSRLQQTRAAGEKDKERARIEGEAERARFAAQQQQQQKPPAPPTPGSGGQVNPSQRQLRRDAQGNITGLKELGGG